MSETRESSAWVRAPAARPTSAPAVDLTREGPAREVRFGLIAIAVFLLVFVGWGAWARLDAGLTAQGEIVVYGNHRAVQHRDGGIVEALDVHDGDHVRAGQVLVRLAAAELQGNAQSLSNAVIQQKALQARLTAELAGSGTIAFPPGFAAMTGDDRVAADDAMRLQRLEFGRRAAALGTERGVLRLQAAQSSEQITGYERQIEAVRRQNGLIGEELAGLRQLYVRGLVPATRMRQLERNQAEFEGSLGQYGADRARAEQDIGEKHIRIQDLVTERDAEDAKDYRATEQQLGELEPKLAALREQIARTVVRAPATGQVVSLTVFTVGGVVAPGQKLMEIVPEGQPLIVAARIRPSDAEGLRVGGPAEVKLSALHDKRIPLLHGVIRTVSADALVEETSHQNYYRVEIGLPAAQLAVLRRIGGADTQLKAGMPVEVVVPTKARSALEYLSGPLDEALWSGFRQR